MSDLPTFEEVIEAVLAADRHDEQGGPVALAMVQLLALSEVKRSIDGDNANCRALLDETTQRLRESEYRYALLHSGLDGIVEVAKAIGSELEHGPLGDERWKAGAQWALSLFEQRVAHIEQQLLVPQLQKELEVTRALLASYEGVASGASDRL